MTLLSLLFWLIAGGTLQVVVPAFRHLGQPAFPFLLGVVLFAAVHKKPRYFVATALLAGVVEDALSLAPLGCSACAFLAAGGLALLLREDFFADKTFVVMVFGALGAATSTGVMALALRMKGLIVLSGGEISGRMAGSALLGAVLIPLLFGAMRRLERMLGIREDRA